MTKSKYIEEKIPKTEIKQRNKFNIDEDLDQSFNIKQFARAIIYVKRHAKKLLVAFIFSIATMLLGLLMPLFTRTVVDDLIPAKDIPGIFKMSGLFLLTVLLLLFCSRMKAVLITKSGQHIIAEIRHDLFSHLQKLPFDYYDSRPHGKILVRVVNYVNAVADFLSN
ncbi:MAG: ABC transporter ATP-binding protein, partial [Clostridiales bacterium]|nr:ABC transporter ATP-binding protein [Clostridiales bacterium]